MDKLKELKEYIAALDTEKHGNFKKLVEDQTRKVYTDYQSLDNWDQVYIDVGLKGTDNSKNTKTGDGDMTPFRTDNLAFEQFNRELWCAGGDLIFRSRRKLLPPFIMFCTIGNVEGVQAFIDMCDNDEDKVEMLETRHCVLRQSPIFFAIVGHLNGYAAWGYDGPSDHLGVVKLLLKHGARCDARDQCGKTVLHYCLGHLNILGYSDKVLLAMADACIERSVELNVSPRLVDIPDRFGDVPAMEACKMNRPDLITFLCVKHQADPTIKNMHGMNLVVFAEHFDSLKLIVRKAKNKFQYAEQRSICVYCQLTNIDTMKCGRCKIATYCSKACQNVHWKEHKKLCCPDETPVGDAGTTNANTNEIIIKPVVGQEMFNSDTFEKLVVFTGKLPKNVAVNELFDIKVQLPIARGGPFKAEYIVNLDSDYMLYNKERDLIMYVNDKACAKKRQLGELVAAYAPTNGQKAYFRAKVNEKGHLVVITDPMFVRKW